MARSWGVFNDEGLCESHGTEAEARAALAERYEPDDECHVAQVCDEHEAEAEHCEECHYPDEDDEPAAAEESRCAQCDGPLDAEGVCEECNYDPAARPDGNGE